MTKKKNMEKYVVDVAFIQPIQHVDYVSEPGKCRVKTGCTQG